MHRWLIGSLAAGGPALALADASAKATIALLFAAAVAAVLRRSSAAFRHRLWGLTLCALALLPPLSWLIPGWRLPIIPGTMVTPDSLDPRVDEGGRVGPRRPRSLETQGGPAPAQSGPDGGRAEPGAAQTDGELRKAPGPSPEAWPLPDRDAARLASIGVALVWASGFLAAASPALAGVVGNSWRRQRSRRVTDPDWLRSLDELARPLGIRRRIELRTSPEPLIPITWGVLRPVVLLPERAGRWPESTRRLVLLHELAHIRRLDVLFQLIGRLAAAVYWFHPLAWYALRRMRAECECACDDHVIHLGVRRIVYARQLVALARSLRPLGLSAAVPMTRNDSLEQRIMALLDDGRNHQPLGRRPARALLAGVIVLIAGLAAVHAGTTEVAGLAIDPTPGPQATSSTTQQAPGPDKPAAKASAPEDPPVAPLSRSYTHPITVTGRAVDPAGRPIPGARVYLASRSAESRRVAETVSDAEGRYAFRDVPLPIERADVNAVAGRDTGSFQVFGQAEGWGFAWRPQKWFHPRPKPTNITYVPDHRDPPSRYEATDKIELDLHFTPAAHLSGTIADDRGNVLPGVRLEISECVSLDVVDNIIPGWSFDTLNERDTAPPSMKIRTTDAQGRFEFAGLPANCRFSIDLRAKGFPGRRVFAATAIAPQPDHDGAPVSTGDFKVTLETSIDVPVRMVFGDTGEPAPRVAVQAGKELVGILETTDERGLAMLRLPPGKYRMENWPARGTPYLVTEGELIVGEVPPTEPVVFALRPAAILEVTVVDADSGAGIPDVDLWEQADPNGRPERFVMRSWEVATRIAWRDSPRTDALGKLRALIEPGKRRIGVGLESHPRGYEVVEPGGREVETRPGQVLQLKFTMRQRR